MPAPTCIISIIIIIITITLTIIIIIIAIITIFLIIFIINTIMNNGTIVILSTTYMYAYPGLALFVRTRTRCHRPQFFSRHAAVGPH